MLPKFLSVKSSLSYLAGLTKHLPELFHCNDVSISYFTLRYFSLVMVLLKGKLFPLQARLWSRGWVGVQLYSSKTTALEGVSVQQHASVTLYPRKRPGTHFQEAGWAPGPVWTGGKSCPNGFRSPDRLSRTKRASN